MLILAFAFVLAIAGTSAAALNQTSNETTINATADVNCSGSDPIINGTVTVNEYGHVRPLEGATVTANSVGGNVLASTTTDANGHYLLNFYSTATTFNIVVSYMGCTSVTQSVTVSNGPNYPTDPNKYGTSNFQLTPKSATLTSTGNGQTVYIQGQNKNGFAGVINVRVDGTTYVAYCIDLFTPISMGDTLLVNGPLPGTAGDLPSGVDWGKVSYILNHYNPTSANEAAAIQCAIWYFTSAPYGAYNASAPVGTYYQYMTAPLDGVMRNWWDDYTVRNRALTIIGEAVSMQYPYNITVTPSQTTIANSGSVTITATVRDINGNPLQGVTVNFQTTRGTLSRTSATTDANGQVTVTLSNIGNNANAVLTAYVSGNYGNLLYDDQYAATRKQNLVARNVLPLTISGFSIINTAQTADVALTQTANTPVNVGDTVTYTVTAHNYGTSTATGILISDIVPGGLSGVTVTPSVGTYYNGVWTIPTLANGASATLTISGKATAAMAGLTTTNTATRTFQEQYNSRSNTTSAAVYTKIANVAVSQTVNGGSSTTGNVGDTVTYVITAVNNGLDSATGLQITDLIPTGLSNINYSINGAGSFNPTTGLWNIGTLTASSTTILTITGKITAAMAGLTTTNYANRTAQTEYNPLAATTSTTLYAKIANVTVSQTVNGGNSATANVGDTVTYVITAVNHGLDPATGLQITDLLPSGLTDINYNTGGSGTYNPTTGLWNIGILNSGSTAILTITGKITAAMAGLTTTNYANRTAQTEYNPSPATTSTTLYTNQANVELTQTVNGGTSGTINVGDTVTIVVTATNNGPNSASNINIAENLPAGFTPTSITPGSGSSYSGGVWSISSLANGETTTLTITGKATAAMAGLTTNNTVNRINQTEYNSLPSSNTATIYTKLSDPIITQTVNGQSTGSVTVNVGDNVTYVVNAYCSGPDNATNIKIKDVVPAGLTDVTVTSSVGTYDPATGIWSIDFLQKYTSATLTITGKAGTSMAGTNITNNALEINQTEYNPAPGNSTSIPVYTKIANLSIAQTVNNPVNVGDVVNFIVTVTNNGFDTATNINISDIIPVGFTAGTPSIGTFNLATGIWNIPSLTYLENATLTINGIATIGMLGNSVNNTVTQINQTEYTPLLPNSIKGFYTKALDFTVESYAYGSRNDWHYNVMIPFVITVKNNLADEINRVIVETPLPEGMEFLSANLRSGDSFEYNSITRILTWTLGNLPGNTLATFEYTLINRIIGLHYINSTITADGQTKTTNWNITTPNSADIEVTQTATNYSPNIGDEFYITITATNNGPSNATGYKLQDILSPGLTLISETHTKGTYSNGLWNIGTLSYNSGIGETATLRLLVRYTAPAANSIYRSSTSTYDWWATNNGQTLTFGSYDAPTPNITTESYAYGSRNDWHYNVMIPFVITVKNNLANELNKVVIEIPLPEGMEFLSANLRSGDSFEYNSITRILTWTLGNLPGNTLATFEYTLINRIIGLHYINSTITADGQTKTTNWNITTPNSADIEVTQTATNYSPNIGDEFYITITATNNGPSNATGYKLQDILSPGLTLISETHTKGTYSNGLWNIGTLSYNSGIGETATLRLLVRYTAPAANSIYRSSTSTYDWWATNNGQSIYPN
nr:Ig-like domain-containing protein [uncultured Methanobacterium sp.]